MSSYVTRTQEKSMTGIGLQVPKAASLSVNVSIMNVSCGKEIQSESINRIMTQVHGVNKRKCSGRHIFKITSLRSDKAELGTLIIKTSYFLFLSLPLFHIVHVVLHRAVLIQIPPVWEEHF